MEDLLHLPRWKKKPVYTKGNVGKDTKKDEKKNFLKFTKISKTQIAKTYLAKITSAVWHFNNPYLGNDLENFYLKEGCP